MKIIIPKLPLRFMPRNENFCLVPKIQKQDLLTFLTFKTPSSSAEHGRLFEYLSLFSHWLWINNWFHQRNHMPIKLSEIVPRVWRYPTLKMCGLCFSGYASSSSWSWGELKMLSIFAKQAPACSEFQNCLHLSVLLAEVTNLKKCFGASVEM